MKQEVKPVYQRAASDHIAAIKAIADANRVELGFINRAKIEQMVGEKRIFVAILDEKVVGFVAFRHRKTDTQTTLSEICLDQGVRGLGYGRGLINALYQDCLSHCRTHIRLKCTADSDANLFYERLGFQMVATEAGKVRRLNVWELHIKGGDMIDSPYALVGLTETEIETALKALTIDAVKRLLVQAVFALQENQDREWRDGYETAVEDFHEALGSFTVRYVRRKRGALDDYSYFPQSE